MKDQTMTFGWNVERNGVEIPIEVEVLCYDSGIGPYEYWGSKEVHHEESWMINSVSGLEKDDELTDDEEKQILLYAKERISDYV